MRSRCAATDSGKSPGTRGFFFSRMSAVNDVIPGPSTLSSGRGAGTSSCDDCDGLRSAVKSKRQTRPIFFSGSAGAKDLPSSIAAPIGPMCACGMGTSGFGGVDLASATATPAIFCPGAVSGNCADFCSSKNGTVPFAGICATATPATFCPGRRSRGLCRFLFQQAWDCPLCGHLCYGLARDIFPRRRFSYGLAGDVFRRRVPLRHGGAGHEDDGKRYPNSCAHRGSKSASLLPLSGA